MIKSTDKQFTKENKYTIVNDSKALLALQTILDRKNTAEIFMGKYGIVIREVSRTTKYTPQQ